ncbi:MAG: NAD(P)H-hydrate dehydratase, partial [Proteobacteria bacterium]|nr:NAD(P)H-hydrate dehydratase [Pseudomonadota bacterium]
KAALTSGAGSVTVLSHPDHSALISVYCPELMTMSYYPSEPLKLTKNPDAIVVGMGLGQNRWSKDLLGFARQSSQPTVYDADALNLFAGSNIKLEKSDVITPHPLEAVRLLETSIGQVQNNRIQAALDLSQKYNCIVVLKGSGSIISNGETSYICPYGSANLATAGSGDVLAGVIAGLIAQNHKSFDAACLGVIWHALSGEFSEKGLCLTASDIINDLHLYL